MAGQLITLPLRVWVRSTQLLTRAVGSATELASAVAGRAVQAVAPTKPAPAPTPEPPSPQSAAPAADEPPATQTPSPADVEQVRRRFDETIAEPAAAITEEPVHVSEEPELVRESAEPGVEDGVGAAVTVFEPWSGYTRMNARDVIDRARNASPAELAAVRLYESRNRGRRTVLDAVDRQLKG